MYHNVIDNFQASEWSKVKFSETIFCTSEKFYCYVMMDNSGKGVLIFLPPGPTI